MRRQDDSLWKGLLDDLTADFIRLVLPGIESVIDVKKRFSHLDKELIARHEFNGTRVQPLFVDKLVRASLIGGDNKWALFHIEVQGKTSNRGSFPKRMYSYYNRIFGKYHIPITAIAIFTGKDGHKMSDKYQNTFLGTEIGFKYNTYNICEASDEQLAKSNNPFSVVILAVKKVIKAEKIMDEDLIQQQLLLIELLLKKPGISKRKIAIIAKFVTNFIVFEDPEMNIIFANRVKQLIIKNKLWD